jgi:hypothetical protein
MYKKIKKIIKTIITKEQKKEYGDFLALQKKWKEKTDKKTQKAAKITDYSNKTLTIQTKNPSWKNEINFMKTEIKKNFHLQT